MKRSFFLLLAALLLVAFDGQAKVRLPRLISDGMVLQRDTELRIWGFADAGEKVHLTFADRTYDTVADSEGRWLIPIDPLPAGGPLTMQINDIVLRDILVGDVWLCSGQSNMELQVYRVMDKFADEVRAYENPMIRHFKVPTIYAFDAVGEDYPSGSWEPCVQGKVMQFSALCYFFAKRMYETTGVPIGLMNISVGGSRVESWMSPEALEEFPTIASKLSLLRQEEYVKSVEANDRLRSRTWHAELNRRDEGLNKWHKADYDDSAWDEADLFDCRWARNEAYRPINGVMWLRRTFQSGEIDPAKPAVLRMGYMIDADSVFVNGTFVGTTSYQYPPRIYPLPAGVLREGENTIAVRLISQGGTSAVVHDKPYKVVQGDKEISLEGVWKHRRGAALYPLAGEAFFRWEATALYHAMLAPSFNYAIKGALWYQGESNTGETYRYGALFENMIEEWRKEYRSPNLPVLTVQLPGYMTPDDNPEHPSGWGELRQVQYDAMKTIPNVATVVTLDCGEWNDIHPLEKKKIGDRLALAARALAYGEKVQWRGPEPQRAICKGDEIVINFTKEGLKPVDQAEVGWIAVAAADRRFVPAKARIERGRLCIESPVAKPAFVRYAWADNPEGASIRNAEGLLCSTFEIAVK